MKKFLIVIVIGVLFVMMLVLVLSVFVQGMVIIVKKVMVKCLVLVKCIILCSKKVQVCVVVKVDLVLDGVVKWFCKEGLLFDFVGDMKCDQVVMVYWVKKNYKLLCQIMMMGVDMFYDLVVGFKLVVILIKVMLFFDVNGGECFVDECVMLEMV